MTSRPSPRSSHRHESQAGPRGQPGHGRERPLDDLVGLGASSGRTELHDIRAHDRAVLAGQYRRMPRCESTGRATVLAAHRRLLVAGACLAQPGVDLLLDNLEDCRIGADERREIRRPHDQGHHCLTGHHGRGARVHLKGSPLSDQLTRTTYGQDMLGAVLTDPDFGEAAENDGRVVTMFSLLHELGADGEYPLVGPGPESALLICGEGVPEIDHGLVLFWWCPPLSRVAAVTVRFLRESCPPAGVTSRYFA